MSPRTIHPGELFFDEFGFEHDPDTIRKYAGFLRREAGLSDEPPIDVELIYEHFGMSIPKRVQIDEQAILIDERTGLVFVKSDDPHERQRFSIAHELIEFLFKPLDTRQSWDGWRIGEYTHHTKENLCQAGAAELLMPATSFVNHLTHKGISFSTARQIASLYEVSITATLVHISRLAHDRYAVILWRMKNKPSELKVLEARKGQLTLFGNSSEYAPLPKLRVEWAMCGPKGDFIPKNKSIHEETSIFKAFDQGTFHQGEDDLDVGPLHRCCYCESQPFISNGEKMVLSLIRYGD